MPPVTATTEEKKKKVNTLAPEVSANELVTPPQQAPVTFVPQPQIPQSIDSTINNVSGFIQSQSENAQRLKEEREAFSQFANEASGFNLQQQQLERFGVTPEKLNRLQDIQLQLANRNTQSEITKSRIAGAEGQTLNQAGREITQEDRERAIRDAGLASEAAVLTGNIETGRALARDAVAIALADREFKANAQLRAIDDLKDVVDEETRQLLVQEERRYQEEQARIEELKTNIAEAMVSGASQEEVRMMNNPNLSDEQKLQMAQTIVARGATELRDLDIRGREEQIRASQANTALRQAELNLSREKFALDSLLSRAKAGDTNAMKQLGLSTEPDEQQYQLATADIQMGINAAKVALKESTGLKLATGAFQSPFLASTLQSVGGGASSGAVLGSIVPGVGTVAGAIAGAVSGIASTPFFYSRTKTSKDEFLASTSFLINDTTFQEIRDLRAQGVTFGNMTEGERIAAGRAAQQLNSAAEIDNSGNVIGFRGKPETIQGYINDIMVAYEGRQEYLNKQYQISQDENEEARNIYYQNNN